ncbi:hypothetical protein GYH30_042742 [Glycine max]|uniref:Myb/SANT-like domain-containing protein n=2 Tax=Glycine subgen. Soja TaxID=1462606 RepID=A0A0R0G3A0_SOYBN|nr:hypothetical protein GYH30_042742 [Glycine max]RZB65145.1 hypothetical protein D0Y65_041267 [Glycine soja]
MMNTNGFGWDDTRNCVTFDNHVYKEFERLQGIFGKDHANGHGVESATDVVENEIGDNQVDGEDWLQHDNSLLSNGNTSARNFSHLDPSKRDFKGEVQKLGFTEKQEYDLDLKFVENPEYQKVFLGTHSVTKECLM